MPDRIEAASSGRAKCRGCGGAIAKGQLRFGEVLPNPFADGEATYWFHLSCAACMRPEKLLEALDSSGTAPDDAAWLRATAEAGVRHPRLARLARAEPSPSGRARCRSCRELIEKDAWRFVLQIFEDGRMQPIGFIHAACAEAYFGTSEVGERTARLCSELSGEALAEIARLAGSAPNGPKKARATPALAKTAPKAPRTERKAKS